MASGSVLAPHSATPELLQLLTPSPCAFPVLAFGGLHALNKPDRHRLTIQRPNDMDNGTWNPEGEAESIYPQGLQKIVSLFESLPEQEKRDALISYADQARKWEPKQGETFDLED